MHQCTVLASLAGISTLSDVSLGTFLSGTKKTVPPRNVPGDTSCAKVSRGRFAKAMSFYCRREMIPATPTGMSANRCSAAKHERAGVMGSVRSDNVSLLSEGTDPRDTHRGGVTIVSFHNQPIGASMHGPRVAVGFSILGACQCGRFLLAQKDVPSRTVPFDTLSFSAHGSCLSVLFSTLSNVSLGTFLSGIKKTVPPRNVHDDTSHYLNKIEARSASLTVHFPLSTVNFKRRISYFAFYTISFHFFLHIVLDIYERC